MNLKFEIPEDWLITESTAAEAAAAGISQLVIDHLREKNSRTPPKSGFRKTDYWDEAARGVTSDIEGKRVIVSIEKEGAALHYFGGTVHPKKKALAIPLSPLVQDIWPSEQPSGLELFWPKNSPHGFLKDKDTSELLYLLVSKATIPADKTVLPEDGDILKAAEEAIWEAIQK